MQGTRKMPFLDTSVIVRYLIGVPEDLARRSREIIDHLDDLQIGGVALAEAAFVLTRVYGAPREHVVDSLMGILGKANVSTFGLDKDFALQALLRCRQSGRVSFADALIWAEARSAGSEIVYSFDERFPSDGLEVRGRVS